MVTAHAQFTIVRDDKGRPRNACNRCLWVSYGPTWQEAAQHAETTARTAVALEGRP